MKDNIIDNISLFVENNIVTYTLFSFMTILALSITFQWAGFVLGIIMVFAILWGCQKNKELRDSVRKSESEKQ